MRFALSAARVTSLLGVFLATAVLMGIIGAGLVAPVVGAAGLTAKESVGMFESLPGDLEENPLAERSRILAADGSLISTPAQQNRIIVASEDISPWMKKAQVAIEDERFYDHGGLDPEGLARAVVQNVTTDSTQGASTLSQQYIKLALQNQALKEGDMDLYAQTQARSGADGYVRKLRELKYAITLEERLTKDEILTGYLNLAFYGNNSYGVEAAARTYFDSHASDLTLTQSALLAGVVRSPSSTNPVSNPEAAKQRRNLVLFKMNELGMITDEQYEKSSAVEIEDMLTLTDSQQSCLNSPNPYFCDYVEAWLMEQPALGRTKTERWENLTTGGYTVETTLDPKLSRLVKETLEEATPPGNEYYLGSAASIVEPGTGHILAFNQSSDYSIDEENSDGIQQTGINWNVDSKYGGPGGMEIGSVAKAFTVIEALDKGMPVEGDIAIRPPGVGAPGNVWVNDPNNPSRPTGPTFPAGIFFRDDFEPGCTIGEDHWVVRNSLDQNHDSTMTLRKATALSVNTAFASLASQVGTCEIGDLMTKMGLHNAQGQVYGQTPNDPDSRLAPSLVLGSDWAAPLTVANSYATIASGGIHCEPVPVTRLLDSDGNELPLEVGECERVVDEDVALGAIDLLKEVVSERGSGSRAILDGDRPAAGKTGTNNNSSHTWFAGFTPQMSTAVFVGNIPGAAQYGGTLNDLTIGPVTVEGPMFGSRVAAPTWKRLMDRALADEPKDDWPEPSQEIMEGRTGRVPDLVGMNVEQAQETLREQGFNANVERIVANAPEGTVVRTTPSAGSQVDTVDPIVLEVSNGPTGR